MVGNFIFSKTISLFLEADTFLSGFFFILFFYKFFKGFFLNSASHPARLFPLKRLLQRARPSTKCSPNVTETFYQWQQHWRNDFCSLGRRWLHWWGKFDPCISASCYRANLDAVGWTVLNWKFLGIFTAFVCSVDAISFILVSTIKLF